jgi:hypothetical protein
MLKTFGIFKFSKMNFSLKKYIKPTHSQEYYDALHYQRHKDKVSIIIIIFRNVT